MSAAYRDLRPAHPPPEHVFLPDPAALYIAFTSFHPDMLPFPGLAIAGLARGSLFSLFET